MGCGYTSMSDLQVQCNSYVDGMHGQPITIQQWPQVDHLILLYRENDKTQLHASVVHRQDTYC